MIRKTTTRLLLVALFAACSLWLAGTLLTACVYVRAEPKRPAICYGEEPPDA